MLEQLSDMEEPSIPIACTLSSDQTDQRLEEFERLFAAHLRELTLPAPRWARFVFDSADQIEGATRDLFARELECCAFFDFFIQREGVDLAVQVEVPAGADASLDGLTMLARRAAPRVLA